MFSFLKEKITKIYTQFTQKAASLFSRTTLDQQLLDELSALLISADAGAQTTQKIMDHLNDQIRSKKVSSPQDVKQELKILLTTMLTAKQARSEIAPVVMLVGVNGSGKTTLAGKLCHNLQKQGKKVLVVAGDTFRAAATQQLIAWAQKSKVDIFVGKENQDPASVVFDACKHFKENNFDHLIIDTAGRLQTKVNLMKELSKIKSIVEKQLPQIIIETWLTIDAMLGQNSFEQAKIFNEATTLTGIVLTKLDGTGKGGIVFALTNTLQLPIVYVTFGEDIDALKKFDPEEYVASLLEI